MASKSGGGSTSRNVVRPGMRNGQPARAQSPRGVSQIGSSMGNKAMNDPKKLTKAVEPVRAGAMPDHRLGNEVAKNVGGGGPGSGRSVMKSGSQHGLPSPAPIGPTRDTLAEFGNHSPNVRGRR
jgi:hypothetical protein